MSIDDLWSKIEAKLDNFKQDLDKRIDGLEDSLAAFKTECVPYQQNENLVAMFGFIVTRLGCDESKIPLASLARLAKSPIAVGSTPPIICEFALRADRNAFYAGYLNHRDLNLSHIGFQNTNRIYVNENLTKEDREIRAAALRLKKEGKVQKVYSRNGIVYAKGRGNAPAEPCPTLEHLAVFR
ncbi:hypothetical protein quinque_011227 [Culex quinquefasciatus]